MLYTFPSFALFLSPSLFQIQPAWVCLLDIFGLGKERGEMESRESLSIMPHHFMMGIIFSLEKQRKSRRYCCANTTLAAHRHTDTRHPTLGCRGLDMGEEPAAPDPSSSRDWITKRRFSLLPDTDSSSQGRRGGEAAKCGADELGHNCDNGRRLSGRA